VNVRHDLTRNSRAERAQALTFGGREVRIRVLYAEAGENARGQGACRDLTARYRSYYTTGAGAVMAGQRNGGHQVELEDPIERYHGVFR
jgi:hypothetical protein